MLVNEEENCGWRARAKGEEEDENIFIGRLFDNAVCFYLEQCGDDPSL